MTRLTAVMLALCLLAAPAFALPAKSELGLVGEFVSSNVEGEENPWTVNLSLLFPVGQGHIVLGPTVVLGSVDELNRMGAGLEWNFVGQGAVSPFIGAAGYYFQKDVDGMDSYTVTGLAGFKVAVGKGAAIKAYAFQIIDGRGADESDIGAAAGVIARF